MNYKARLDYDFLDYNKQFHTFLKQFNIPISRFYVVGAQKVINLSSTSDFSITSELAQAHAYKNIVLFMRKTNEHLYMKIALELTTAANNKNDLHLIFGVEKYSAGKLLQHLYLRGIGKMERPPDVEQGGLFMKFSFDRVGLFHSVYDGNNMISHEEL